MAKILVTGGTGYIGSHMVVELLKDDFEVLIVDNLVNSEAKVVDGIEAITGKRTSLHVLDLCDLDGLRSLFDSQGKIEAVIHFAALKAVGQSMKFPAQYYHNNLLGMLNLLQCMEQFEVPSLVFSSSCTVYGEATQLPVTEEEPVKRPASTYGNTKKICEEIMEDVVKAHTQLRAISLRYFNPIGAHDSILIGENPTGIPDNLMPFITQTAAGFRDKLLVFGDDYDTPDGTCVRDYIHVTDLAEAHMIALKRLLEQKNRSPYETFNLGTGKGHSVLEVIKSFEKMSGQKLNYEVVGRRDGDIEQIYASTDLANKELGWKATRGLDEMTSSAWKWQGALKTN